MQDLRQPSIPAFTLPKQTYSLGQMEREFELQLKAGYDKNTNFKQVREQAARELEAEDSEIYEKSVENSLLSGNLTAEGAVAFDSVYEHPVRDASVSLETMAANNEQAEAYADDTHKVILDSIDENPSSDDDGTKAWINLGWQHDMEEYFRTGTFPELFGEFVTKMVPFISELDEQAPGALSFLYTSKKDDWDKMMKEAWKLPPEQYKAFLYNVVGQHLKSMTKLNAEEVYRRGMETKDYAENAFTVIDAVSMDVIKLARMFGNAGKSVNTAAKAIKEGSKAVAIQESLPTAIKGGHIKDMNWHNSVQHELFNGKTIDVLDDIVEAARTENVVVDKAELDILVDAARKKMSEGAAPSVGDPVDYLWSDTVEVGNAGEWLYHALFGPSPKGEGGGFISEKLAENFAQRGLRLKKGQYTIHKAIGDGTGYYIDAVQGLSEEALRGVSTGHVDDFKTRHKGVVGAVERWLSGSTVRSSEEHKRSIEAARKATVIQDKMNQHLEKVGASKKDWEKVDEAIKYGHTLDDGNGKWLTAEQLDELGLTDKQKQLYKACKEVNDTTYAIMNDAIVREATAKGFGMDSEGMIVREINPKSVTHDMFDRMVIQAPGQKLTSTNISGAQAMKLIEKGNYKLMEIHTGYINSNLLSYNYKLVPAEKASLRPLPRFITNYQEGGPRAYQFGSYYIKAGRAWQTGENVLNAHPITLMAVTSEREAREVVEDYGKLWDIAKKYEGHLEDSLVDMTKDIEAAELKRLNINDGEDLLDIVRTDENYKGILDLSSEEYKPRVLRHGEEITYNNGRRSLAKPTGLWDDPTIELINNNWKFGKGRRTKLLRDIQGQPAAMKSYKEMTARSIQRAANAGVWADYKRYMETSFRRDFSSVIDTQGGRYNPYALSDTTLIKTAKILPEAAVDESQKDLVRAAKRFQDIYMMSTNVRTEADQAIHRAMTGLGRRLLKTDLISPEMAENIADSDPSKAIRSLHFAASMGWWNTAQAWKQMLGTVSAFAAHPVDCTKAMLAYMPIRAMYRYKDTHPALYKAFRKTAATMGGYGEDALDGLMKYMDQFGTLSSIKRLPGVDEARAASIFNTKLWKSSYFFTEMGTNFNYGVTDTMAFMERWAKKSGKIGQRDLAEIAARADDLYVNMSRTTQSKLQSSTVGSWVTQWLSYPMRMMESVLNRRLTAGERMRIAAQQISMWGVGGTFLDEENRLAFYDWLTQDAGMDKDVANLAVNGYVTYLGRLAGVEINEGLQLGDLFKNQLLVYKLATEQELVLPKVPAGNFPGVIASVYNAINDLIFPDTTNFNMLVYLKKRATDKTLPTGLKNVSKAALMMTINRVYNNSGELVKEDADTRDAILQLLGFNSSEGTEMYYKKLYEDAEGEVIRDYASQLEPMIEEWYMTDISSTPEDPEATFQKKLSIENRIREASSMYYETVKDNWGAEAAEKFQLAVARAWTKDLDKNMLKDAEIKMMLKSPRKSETITGFMNKENN